MALFRDTEKLKDGKGNKLQSKASLKRVNNYISRDDKVGKVEDNRINGKNEEVIIENLLNRKDNTVFAYVTQDKKTEQKLVTGINCRPSSAFDEMMLIKKIYNKTDRRQFKHFVHSYSKDEKNLTPEMAHEITLKLMEHQKFKGFQLLVATHIDTDHIHSHIVINSVNMETGKKWNHSTKDIANIRELSNKLCKEYGLEYSFVGNKDKEKQQNKGNEYRAKEKGKSWKYEAFLAISKTKKLATTKEEFIKNLQDIGYGVRWVDERKDIQLSFNTPDGKARKINFDKFHPKEYFTKEALLEQFKKNKEYQANKQAFESKVKRETLQELYFKTINFLFENPDQGDKDYPLTYLEGQALKEKMMEDAKGRGFDWEKEQER